MSITVSVLLIRELPAQLTGSGCCGKLEGQNAEINCGKTFTQTRREQEQFGVLHRAIRSFFDEETVSIVTVDPRNQLYLNAKLWHDVFTYRPGFRESLKTVLQLFSAPAVIVNGRILSKRGLPLKPDELCHHVQQLLDGDHQHSRKAVSDS